jgi:hypothetical protein
MKDVPLFMVLGCVAYTFPQLVEVFVLCWAGLVIWRLI